MKLLTFDFDLTIAVVHLYHKLAARINEDNMYTEGMTDAEYRTRHADAMLQVYKHQSNTNADMDAIFGGSERRRRLAAFFDAISGAGKNELYVITHGYTGVVSACLERAGYLKYFRDVIGIDHAINDTCQGDKLEVVKSLNALHGVEARDSLLVDDDLRNLVNMRGMKELPTLWIWPREGMRDIDLERVERFAGVSQAADAQGVPVYSAHRALVVPQCVAHAVEQQLGKYFTLSGAESLDSAVQKCNAVPLSRRIEGVRLVHHAHPRAQPQPQHVDPMQALNASPKGMQKAAAAPGATLLYATRAEVLDFNNMVMKLLGGQMSLLSQDVQGSDFMLPADEVRAPQPQQPAATPGQLRYSRQQGPLAAAVAAAAPGAKGSVEVVLRPEEVHVSQLIELLRDPAMKARMGEVRFTVNKS